MSTFKTCRSHGLCLPACRPANGKEWEIFANAMLKNAHREISSPSPMLLPVCVLRAKRRAVVVLRSCRHFDLVLSNHWLLSLCLPQALGTAQVDKHCQRLVRVLMRCSVVSVDPVLQSAATSGYWVSDGIFCFLLAHSFQIVWYVITMCASSCQNRIRSFMDVKEGSCHNSLSLWPERFGGAFTLLA